MTEKLVLFVINQYKIVIDIYVRENRKGIESFKILGKMIGPHLKE